MGFSYLEKKAFKNGFKIIAGADEAGRGSLAGPVAGAVVTMKYKDGPCSFASLLCKNTTTKTVLMRDSKQLSAKQRELIFEKIKQEPNIEWNVSFVYPNVIDRINILQATKLAWKRCLSKFDFQPDFLFIDGNQGIEQLEVKQQTVIKGDQKIFLVSLASIIAKVSRDRLMARLSVKYPEYNFNQHKGYGTKLHFKNLKKFGPCVIHRKSFRPICKI